MLTETSIRKVIKEIAEGVSSYDSLHKLARTSSTIRDAVRLCSTLPKDMRETLARGFVNCYLAGVLCKLEIKEETDARSL